VPVGVDGSGRGEALLVQHLHEEELPDGGEAGEIEPVVVGAVLYVFSVLLDAPEGVPAQTRQFQHHQLALRSHALVDVRLLPHSDLAEDVLDEPSLEEGVKGQVVVSQIGQLVAVA